MGSVYRRKDGRWVGKYQDLEGSWRYLYRKSKQEAKQALQEALRDQEERISPDKITVKRYLEDWLQDQQGVVSERTLLITRVNLETHIYPALGEKRLWKLTAKDIRCAFKDKDLKPATINKILGTFSQALNDAVGKYLRSNPCKEIKRVRQPREEIRVLSPAQMRTLLDAAHGDRFEGVIVLGATCGLRIGEIVGLKWSDLDPVKAPYQSREPFGEIGPYLPRPLAPDAQSNYPR
jgi:integrase